MLRFVGFSKSAKAINMIRENMAIDVTTDANGLYGKDMAPTEFARAVVDDVKMDGDEAVKRITNALQGYTPANFEVPREDISSAINKIGTETLNAIKFTVDRVTKFQTRAKPASWWSEEEQYGEEIRPINRVGIYVPGGTASLISTLIMTAVPAKVAGVNEIVLTTPGTFSENIPQSMLAAASICGVDRVFNIGGAQAIAALAYGTQSVPRCDMVTGPGNVFTSAAKLAVTGDAGIDGIFGPTETVIIADDTANPEFVAADLLAQAEHDVNALPIVISIGENVAKTIEECTELFLEVMPRKSIASASMSKGLSLVVDSKDEAVRLANLVAPEHLCLSFNDAEQYLEYIQNAGGIFLGEFSAEVMADYVAGPSHVMPTGGSARFASALSVRNFVKISPVINFSREKFQSLAPYASKLAREEKLEGHAIAAEIRDSSSKNENGTH